MQLSQMQDIGGCRAIVTTVKQLDELVDIYRLKPLTHTNQGTKNYIKEPKEDGYRSVHLMYRFVGSATSRYWDKLRIEIQLRTKLQHAWSTAVETVDTFIGEEGELKFGLGSHDWRRFFQLMGSAHASIEKSEFVSNTPDQLTNLKTEIKYLEEKLDIINLLRSWSQITQHIIGVKGGKDYWYLIEIKPDERKIEVESFSDKAREAANERYKELELKDKGSRNQGFLFQLTH
jgi:hypothetical protein